MRLQDFQIRRRGSASNPEGRFETYHYENFEDGWDLQEEIKNLQTEIKWENSVSIVTKNDSPDIPFSFSINPYRGCEHGCIYCYARPNHSYVNLSPGLDFETKLFAKSNAAKLLEDHFSKKNYKPVAIALGSATDPYQPIEKKLQVTHSLLEIFLKWKHPLSIITKSALVLQDIDILSELARENLVRVFISITTENSQLASLMEPRAATPSKRFLAIEKLARAGISVGIMNAPIIPGLNDHEMESILQKGAEAGAKTTGYVLVRLPYEVKDLFSEWLEKYFPLKKDKVMNLIRSTRNGEEYNSDWGQRMTGTGNYAELIQKRFQAARKRYGLAEKQPPLSTDKFQKQNDRNGQMLFSF